MNFPGDLRLQYPVSQTVPVDGPRLATTQFNDIYGPESFVLERVR
jgi:hypothetical protein